MGLQNEDNNSRTELKELEEAANAFVLQRVMSPSELFCGWYIWNCL